jgi:hypothetical protein
MVKPNNNIIIACNIGDKNRVSLMIYACIKNNVILHLPQYAKGRDKTFIGTIATDIDNNTIKKHIGTMISNTILSYFIPAIFNS